MPISKMLREVRAKIPPVDASRPITSLTTPVPTPPHEADTPAPATAAEKVAEKASRKVAGKASQKVAEKASQKISEKTGPRRRLTRKVIFTLAMATAIGLGLWHDDVGRSDVTGELGRAASAVSGFVVESLIR